MEHSKLPYALNKECHVLQTNTKHVCKAKVGKKKHDTPTPTYRGLKEYCSNNHVPT